MNLYKLADDFNALMECESDDEITSALADIIAGEIEVKAENCCKFLKTLESTIDAFHLEEERIKNARKVLENKESRMKEYMKSALLSANIDKLTAGTFKISIGLSAGSLVIADQDKIPARFKTVVTSVTVDKNAVKEAIKAGEKIEGATIEAGYVMRIK